MSSYWYQKEYEDGKLCNAFLEVAYHSLIKTFKKPFSKISYGDDLFVLKDVLRKLCVEAVITQGVSLNIEERSFTLKERVGENETFFQCKQIKNGWLVRVGGVDIESEIIGKYGWRKLNNEHPLINAPEVCVGPSSSPLLCGEGVLHVCF